MNWRNPAVWHYSLRNGFLFLLCDLYPGFAFIRPVDGSRFSSDTAMARSYINLAADILYSHKAGTKYPASVVCPVASLSTPPAWGKIEVYQ